MEGFYRRLVSQERDHLANLAFLGVWARDREVERRERERTRDVNLPERIGGPGLDFFFGTVESVRRTLKRLSADADWPDRSARPGLLPECVSTDWSPRVHLTYTQALSSAHT